MARLNTVFTYIIYGEILVYVQAFHYICMV
nr:MAG TPA: hypothetical protein [Caudoviricetes sp.]